MNSYPRPIARNSPQPTQLTTTLPRIMALLLLFASAAVFEARNLTSLSALSNGDIWWHLRTGMWILQTHGVPHNGLVSQSPELPWRASSWAYDLLAACGFRLLGLRLIPVILMKFKFLFAIAAFFLAGGLRGKFWPAIVLSAIAQYILGSIPPGPGYCSILFFAFELFLLNEIRRRGNRRSLFWLPPLFLLWANLDIQFVFGILLLALFLITSLLQNFARRSAAEPAHKSRANTSPKDASIVAALCAIATLITPYFYHLYGSFFASLTSAANRYFPDYRAMTFRQPQDYLLLLLTMTAFLTLGIRRSRDPFQIVLMIGCAMLSFYAQRDAWLAVVAAIAVIGEAIRVDSVRDTAAIDDPEHDRARTFQVLNAFALSVIILFVAAAFVIPGSQATLLARAAQTYPVAAANYIREHQLPQPLFNAYEWGGFLTWYLPEYPAAVDSRTGMYDDEFIVQYSKAMNADAPYQTFPPMANAGTLLLQRKSLMGEALSSVTAFRVAYTDKVAVVLTRP
jgi:hypothetical protein